MAEISIGPSIFRLSLFFDFPLKIMSETFLGQKLCHWATLCHDPGTTFWQTCIAGNVNQQLRCHQNMRVDVLRYGSLLIAF